MTIRVSDRAASEAFYDTVLEPLGIDTTYSDARFAEWDDFSLTAADAEHPVTRRLHVAFGARSRELVEAFWRAGTQAGHRDDGAPGPRPQYRDDYYGGFLLDPDGNSAEAVHHAEIRPPGHIDHLWIRVADVAGRRGLLRPRRALRRLPAQGRRARPRALRRRRRLVLARGRARRPRTSTWPSRRPRTPTVDAFHRRRWRPATATTARPASARATTRGYYGAYVLDPDAQQHRGRQPQPLRQWRPVGDRGMRAGDFGHADPGARTGGRSGSHRRQMRLASSPLAVADASRRSSRRSRAALSRSPSPASSGVSAAWRAASSRLRLAPPSG